MFREVEGEDRAHEAAPQGGERNGPQEILDRQRGREPERPLGQSLDEYDNCGTDAANVPPGCAGINGAPGSGCDASCQALLCGNATLDGSELCDDGNTDAGDGCAPDCGGLEVCGDGRIDLSAGETCDCGTALGYRPAQCAAANGDPAGFCGADCQLQ